MNPHTPLTIGNVRIVGSEKILPATHVRVAAGMIDAVGDAAIAREHDQRIDGAGATLLPGLIDSHVHLLPGCTQLAPLFGVATLIDLFSKPAVIDPERARGPAGGRGEGPIAADLRTSSIGATAPGGHPSLAYSPLPYVTCPQDAERFVIERISEGADHLKIIYDDGSGVMLDIPALSAASIEALVVAAHRHGLVVVAHVSTAEGAMIVARAGVDVLAHAPMDRMSSEQVEQIADVGVAVIATLSILDGFPGANGVMPLLNDPRLADRLPPRWRRVVESQARRWLPPQLPDGQAQRDNVACYTRLGCVCWPAPTHRTPGWSMEQACIVNCNTS